MAMHSGPGVLSPFMKEIYLTRQIIVGLRYQGGAKELLKDLKPGEKVSFLREPDNRFDRKAIMAVDEDGRKLGYIPRTQNDILASLMDAGKVIYGIVTDRQMVSRTGQTPGSIWVDLYMREFAMPGVPMPIHSTCSGVSPASAIASSATFPNSFRSIFSPFG